MHLRHRLLAIPLLLAALHTARATPVRKVEIVGNRRIEADAIREKMKIKEGAEPTPEQVRADIQAIFALGYFEDVRFEQNIGNDLVVTVRERPVITDIRFEGASEFEKKDLDEASGIKPFTVVSLSKIRAAQSTLAKKYEEKGYYLARADYTLTPVPNRPGEVALTFNITENEKVRIRKVFFLGNRTFTSADLKKVMLTSEGHVFSWATNGGTYRESAFDRDLSALAFFYGNEGYIEAKFAKPRVTLSQDRRYVDIFIDVEEGKRYYLGEVTFKGDDLLFTPENLRASFGIKDGDVFSTGKLQEEVLKLTDKYGDEGYAFANVIPRTQIREGTDKVDLTFDIEKGEKVYWGKISVTGNAKTHDKVIRRELPFAEGELYNATKRKKGLEKVRRLGFFGNDVNFLTSTPQGSNNVLNLEIRVAEKPTGSLNVSAGYGSGAGFVFGAQISQNNLFGRGQQLNFNMNLNARSTKTFSLGFADPHINDSEWFLGTSLYKQDTPIGYDPVSYNQDLLGGSVRLGRELIENLTLYGSYKLELSRLNNIINCAILTDCEKDKRSVVSSVTATLEYDSRNNRLDPSGGEYLQASSEFAGLGGRVFQKYLVSARMYRRIGWKFVYRTNLEYGLLANSLNGDSVPDTERFILGGVFSLRGYPPSTVGPAIPLQDLRPKADGTLDPAIRTYVKGGTHKLLFNNEIEFPLIPEADIRAVFFVDVGQAWNSLSDRSPSLLGDAGWGIRWYSPLGPLRFEWGYPFATTPLKRNTGAEFNFIIAPTF